MDRATNSLALCYYLIPAPYSTELCMISDHSMEDGWWRGRRITVNKKVLIKRVTATVLSISLPKRFPFIVDGGNKSSKKTVVEQQQEKYIRRAK